ncbi:probable KEM1 - multifunctional nuclease [Melanopsichium pennsylvanicum]|uniref:5'-3' exoribonuclease 1 n=2 Tax=Melanopsichium pennsylvanicum TaxID=63383 RepID=A0AAJ4XI81_9BASI|nr:probable KEM1-5`-3` exonuclease component of cytoplasmic processing (P) bodies [Melanopsichium pennsylvanicum 4]SNX82446.1 probable KEM1 - multifunctional nuclease [Melanopsichium pennsylvanicum]
MGIPKFFRFMSERYPLISQLIEENKIPEFDNLYLDMNGIIHNCSHPNDNDASFRITETQIFLAVFAYIEHLFHKIKPKKVFFLAVDGVAPRAKMNQQRSRRFRTAKEAKEIKEKAERRGEILPEEEAFDSNCITPGTPFMAKLSQQLEYFIAKKISEDADWRNVQVILSGHDVPGEGEHKIMEYVRLCKAQPDYNPNVRHCLYGLDADLIMLGLLSHDPHFCLLREEVQFGPRRKSKGGLESQNFFLLHLSLFREYLDLEFQDLRSTLPFPYEFERIIDDFILLNIFVGNDFLPHLPGLHINEGAMDLLFNIYKQILPVAGGYLNEGGNLRTDRLELVLTELCNFEMEQFERDYGDTATHKAKVSKNKKAITQVKAKGGLVLTKSQRELFDKVHAFVMARRRDPSGAPKELLVPADLPNKEKRFLEDLASSLKLRASFNKIDATTRQPAIALSFPSIAPEDDDTDDGSSDEDEDDDDSEQHSDIASAETPKVTGAKSEADAAVDRVMSRYLKAKVDTASDDEADPEEDYKKRIDAQMTAWKKDYYKEKLEIDYNNDQAMGSLAFRYIEGLQWVLHYYYDGVASWGWFYDYHYAPKISDLKKVGQMKFEFVLGKPFRPFDQLMGVLPALSNQHIPTAFRDLMTDPDSPIIDFYPQNFAADLNGKKQDWEAVVKIPFIDEKRLLETLDKREIYLGIEERKRNGIGHSREFTYNEQEEIFFPSSLPGTFPDLVHCRAAVKNFNLPTLDGLHLVKGLTKGVELGVRALAGFPSLKTLPHYGRLGHHGVNIFQSESKGVSMVVTIENAYEDAKTEAIAEAMIGNRAFLNWPFLTEGLVVGVSDNLFRYEVGMVGGQQKVIAHPHQGVSLSEFQRKAERTEYHYSKRMGILIGDVDVLVHIRPLKGLKRLDDGAFIKDYEETSKKEIDQAVQLTVTNVVHDDTRFLESPAKPIREEYPDKTKVFFLGANAYGTPAHVVGSTDASLAIEVAFFPNQAKENAYLRDLVSKRARVNYYPSYQVAKRCGITSLALAKLTSSMMLAWKDQKVNVGLRLKFEAKGEKVLGYSRKSAAGWEFSEKALELVKEHVQTFPEIAQMLSHQSGVDITRASQIWDDSVVDEKMAQLKDWIKAKGVRALETVPLYAEQLSKETVSNIEAFTSRLVDTRTAIGASSQVKRVFIKGIPRTALLKPSHAPFRLQAQRFELGDRVIMVQDSGNVPLSARGVVVGINSNSLEVVFDVPFLSGTTLGDRCAPYKGAAVSFVSVLNLTQPQFVCAGTAGVGDTSASVGSALERTLGPIGGKGSQSNSNRNGAHGYGAGASSYRPPNAFTPSVTAQNGRGRGGSTQLLQRPQQRHAPVSQDVAFSGVASGAHQPTRTAAAAPSIEEINPIMAALGIRPPTNGYARGNPARGGARGGARPARNPIAVNLPQPPQPPVNPAAAAHAANGPRGRGGRGGGRGRGGPPPRGAVRGGPGGAAAQ